MLAIFGLKWAACILSTFLCASGIRKALEHILSAISSPLIPEWPRIQCNDTSIPNSLSPAIRERMSDYIGSRKLVRIWRWVRARNKLRLSEKILTRWMWGGIRNSTLRSLLKAIVSILYEEVICEKQSAKFKVSFGQLTYSPMVPI